MQEVGTKIKNFATKMPNFAKIVLIIDSEQAVTFNGYIPFLTSLKTQQHQKSFHITEKIVKFAEKILELKFDLAENSCTGINLLFHDYKAMEEKLVEPAFLENIRAPGSYVLLAINPSSKYNKGYYISHLGTYEIPDLTQEPSFNSRAG